MQPNPQRAQQPTAVVAACLALTIFPLLFVRVRYAGLMARVRRAIETLQATMKPGLSPVELPARRSRPALFQAGALGAV